MTNIQETRNLHSTALTSDLALMAGDPRQILRSTDDSSFYTTFRNPWHAVQEPAIT